MADRMPAAEHDVDVGLVRALLEDQHPDLAGLPLRLVANGWDNVIFRLGDDLTVRLPRRQMGADLVANEQRWLPVLAPRLPLPIPAPVRVGHPAHGYPWSWSVVPWFDGEVAGATPPADGRQAAETLGAFIAALHQPAPDDAPANTLRGGPLSGRQPYALERIDHLAGRIDAAAVRARWHELASAPAWDGPPLWLHGDLHPANILVADGRIRAVIDFGDITGGDPATDLSVAWLMFDGADRAALRTAAGARDPIDDDTWERAKAWALHYALIYLQASFDHPVLHAVGKRAMAAVMDDRSGR